MRKLILFLLIVCFNVLCYGQSLNYKAQKMIKKIERIDVKTNEVVGVIEFIYNDFNRLINLKLRSKYNGTVVFNKNGDTMNRTDYNIENTIIPTSYSFKFGDNGYIKEQTINQNGGDGSVLRYVYNYYYNNAEGKLSQILRRTLFSENGSVFETRKGDYVMEYLGWFNENIYTSRMMFCEETTDGGIGHDFPIDWNEKQYSEEFINDTNIDFFELYKNYGNSTNLENMTEWVGCKSKYLIESCYGGRVSFFYSFSGSDYDNKGNIDKLVVKQFNKILYVFKFYYD